MISYFRKKKQRKKLLRMFAELRRELAIGFSSKRHYTQGQITNTFKKTNHDSALLPFAIAVFSNPNEVETILKDIKSKKTTKELYKNFGYVFGMHGDYNAGDGIPYTYEISNYYETSILPSLTHGSFDSPGGSDSGFDTGGFSASDSGGSD